MRVADLPPLPALDPNRDPNNPLAAFAPQPVPGKPGAFVTGPNFAPQVYSPDPGRALITGKYEDFEAFDVPQLRGIAKTAPYFHDNQSATLVDVIDFYSRNVFPFVGSFIGLLPPGTPPQVGVDVLTQQQKDDLLAFLNVF